MQNCNTQFTQIFTMGVEISKLTDEEEKFKKKEKLFGNVYFIGELYKKYLLPEKVIVSCQVSLLGLENAQLSENTLEAGLMFINKVGLVFDERTA